MSDNSGDSSNPDRVWGMCIAITFGMFFLFFVVGLAFSPRDPDTTLGALASVIALTLWLGSVTVGGIATAANRPWGERLTERLFGLAVVAIQAIFICHLFTGRAAAASYYAVVIWVGVGLAMYFGKHEEGARKPTYLDCSLWPLLALLMSPIASICLFVVPAVMVVGGEWVGAKVRHPHVGAAVGFGVFLGVAFFVMTWSNRQTADLTYTAQKGDRPDTDNHGE